MKNILNLYSSWSFHLSPSCRVALHHRTFFLGICQPRNSGDMRGRSFCQGHLQQQSVEVSNVFFMKWHLPSFYPWFSNAPVKHLFQSFKASWNELRLWWSLGAAAGVNHGKSPHWHTKKSFGSLFGILDDLGVARVFMMPKHSHGFPPFWSFEGFSIGESWEVHTPKSRDQQLLQTFQLRDEAFVRHVLSHFLKDRAMCWISDNFEVHGQT